MKKMQSKNMMILGGYGSAGICISRLLLQETDVDLILAGHDDLKAQKAASLLNAEFVGNRVQSMQVDASNPEELREAFKHCDTVISCVPITALGIGGGVVQAAFDAGVNYIDITLDEDKQQLLQQLGEQIKRSGRYFMTEAGFMPGLPSMMAYLAAERLDKLQSLKFGMLEKEKTGAYGSAADLLIYAADPAYIFEEGAWHKAPITSSARIDFGPGFGEQSCYPMNLYELRSLPEKLDVQEAGFYAAGMNPVTDFVMLFWVISGLYKYDWSLRLGAKFGIWTVKKFTRPPFTTTILLDAKGGVNHHNVSLRIVISHDDGYEATAIAAVAGILQLLDGSIEEPGVIIMGHGVNPNRYLEDIERLGMNVQIKESRVDCI
jgi:NAD(P)-dependent dehydrogenase (short-subunit alcohol dehydrogenase family)